jgi:hypothetical protein
MRVFCSVTPKTPFSIENILEKDNKTDSFSELSKEKKEDQLTEKVIINTAIERIEENEEFQAVIQSNASQLNIDQNPKRKENENK